MDKDLRKEYIDRIKKDVHIMKYLPLELKSDRNFIIEATEILTKQHYAFLRYVDNSLKDDKEVVIKVVSKVADALVSASDRLKNDNEVLLAAVKNDLNSLVFAHQDLKNKLKGKTLNQIVHYFETAILHETLHSELSNVNNIQPKVKL